MALPRDYTGQFCSLARALEIVGERWTLLIVRDAFYGVRRFTDFLVHLQIPRAVLTDRLAALVDHGVLERVSGAAGYDEYVTTEKGRALWPAVLSLMSWGDEYYAADGRRRLFAHTTCGSEIDASGRCPICDVVPGLSDLTVLPGPGLRAVDESGENVAVDAVTATLAQPHAMLQPLDTKVARVRQQS